MPGATTKPRSASPAVAGHPPHAPHVPNAVHGAAAAAAEAHGDAHGAPAARPVPRAGTTAGSAAGAAAGAATGAPAKGAATSAGRDVADVHVRGLEFPFPGYLDNLVRQVRIRFAPSEARAGLRADLAFVVGRDGSVTGLRVVRGSGNYAFDLEAQGAVEAAGAARAFGPLPDGFRGATLPVTFSFDPRSTP